MRGGRVANANDPGWYLEDFEVGQTLTTMGRTITETDIVDFVALGGIFEELFINAEYAKTKSLFNGRVVPGLLVLVVAEGLFVLSGRTHHARAYLGLDALRLLAPVLCGDTVSMRATVEAVRPSNSRPDTGVLTLSHLVVNQDGVETVSYMTNRLIERRAD
jgi:acyl dehydratase